ncbi:uncharacterized protein ACHE_10805S [Aspergillus chevalieri]|uniref:Amine oxidase domain-containing protein n=1 Tax=Aspergillus chevalieri TaxID=182096 RepID=A0A7R7ZIM0_ASPCH|nr:uncharacterized protein ACHE_10805S [Aspergillus chevalieri]BCR83403.1 hypothetical protein ACHE_10805S [Aspergillus chevalieri]
MSQSQPKRVAVIGGSCAGVTSFWALQHSVHDVHLFEASSELGRRIKTVPFEDGETRVNVNTESPCFNSETSPNLVSLLRSLWISTSPISLRFSASDSLDTYQWGYSILENVLLRPWCLCSLETYRILFDIIWLKYLVLGVLIDRDLFSSQHRSRHTSDAYNYLSNEGFSSSFRDRYLTPLLSTLWGTNAGRFLPRLSIKDLVQFLHDRDLLCIQKFSIPWRRMDVTASQFVQRMAGNFPADKVHFGAKVQQVKRTGEGKYGLFALDGEEMDFDHVIFAVDSDEILRLLQPTKNAEEREILQDIRMTNNIAVLHSNPSSTSNAPYNYIISPDHNPNHLPPMACLTYNINTLQNIPTSLAGPISITINPFNPPHPTLVQAVWEFADTEISTTSLHAFRRLPSIQNKSGLSYCSTWTGRGFLEDAVTGGLRVAVEHLGADVPFEVDLREGKGLGAGLAMGFRDHLILTVLGLLRVYVRIFELALILLELFWVWITKD